MIPLSLRLSTIKDMTPEGVAADVGADHGKLILSLSEAKKIDHGYAIENKKGPFDILKKAISLSNEKDKIVPLFSDGIRDLPNDVNILIIAGMGGNTIIDILKSQPEKLKNVEYIIIDAHSLIDEVRKEITSLGYYIQDEEIILEDEIYYEIIKFHKGTSSQLNDDEFLFGPVLLKKKSKDFLGKWQKRILEIDYLLSQENIPQNKKSVLEKEKERILTVL